jgi:hypothetical protein
LGFPWSEFFVPAELSNTALNTDYWRVHDKGFIVDVVPVEMKRHVRSYDRPPVLPLELKWKFVSVFALV